MRANRNTSARIPGDGFVVAGNKHKAKDIDKKERAYCNGQGHRSEHAIPNQWSHLAFVNGCPIQPRNYHGSIIRMAVSAQKIQTNMF